MNEIFIGVVSDTHGLIREAVKEHLAGASLILHAGDIGTPSVIRLMQEIAPVIAVRGNVDREAWAEEYPLLQMIDVFGTKIVLVHERKGLGDRPLPNGVKIVVCGHSHRADIQSEHDILYFNPGSIGPRRFRLPVTMGRLIWSEGKVLPEVITLE